MQFHQNELTGSRVIAPLSPLGKGGPQHHGIVIGECAGDGKIYVAESKVTGYRLVTLEDFQARHAGNGEIEIQPNDGAFSDFEVAKRALAELASGGDGPYNLVTNNCESFSNRAMYGHSLSGQVIKTIIGAVALVAGVWVTKGFAKNK